MDIPYDSETFPNCFLLCIDYGQTDCFEISTWRNDLERLAQFVQWVKRQGHRMVGFNNLGFDYPILHYILKGGITDPLMIYQYAKSIIDADSKFQFYTRPSDRLAPQIDLFKIHHFDNKAKMTSLKTLEFTMRMENISDLPFPVGTVLSRENIGVLRDYCHHDVTATKLFLEKTRERIAFREQLGHTYGYDFLNHNDVKIGKDIFQVALEKAGVQCYEYGPEGRQPRQTLRDRIRLADCIPPFIQLTNPGFVSVLDCFRATTITQTKGALKDLKVMVGGLEFKFGTGGIHASIESGFFNSKVDWMIWDIDVKSLYPSIAIGQGYYPEHLGKTFVNVYTELRDRRMTYPKGSPENDMLKLALNGVYGVSNDVFSIFYDPLFTMRITIGGQLMLAMLVERLLCVPGLRIIQANTDGITVFMHRSKKSLVNGLCAQWEKLCSLQLEGVEYDHIAIADVNSYIARDVTGKVKRKGRYEHELEWHQDASALVVPKIAEKVILEDMPTSRTLQLWGLENTQHSVMDFMLRAKVNKGSRLVIEVGGEDVPLDNTQRYYIAKGGYPLVKIMPPLKGKTEERRIHIQKGFGVCPCNDFRHAVLPIDYSWYANEIDKLTVGVI